MVDDLSIDYDGNRLLTRGLSPCAAEDSRLKITGTVLK